MNNRFLTMAKQLAKSEMPLCGCDHQLGCLLCDFDFNYGEISGYYKNDILYNSIDSMAGVVENHNEDCPWRLAKELQKEELI
jgi:hypothetical protein